MSNQNWTEGLSIERITLLMDHFKKREVNEINYDRKMKFWKNVIIAECDRRHQCSFSINELKTFFLHKGRSPVCLQNVVVDMLREGIIKFQTEFEQLTYQNNSNWSTWVVNTLVKIPVSWFVGKIKESILSPIRTVDQKTKFVILELVKDQADKLLNKISTVESQIISMDDIQEHLCVMWKDDVSMTSTKLIVHSLEISNKVFVERKEHLAANKILVKIAGSGQNVESITEFEKNLFKLKETEKILIGEIGNMNFEIEGLINKTKSYLAKNMKPIALIYLRKKKDIEKRMDKQYKFLENVQVLISKIGESKYKSDIMKTYTQSLTALKLTINGSGLTIANIEKTMSELAEVIEENNDIQTTMNSLVDDKFKHDEQELEDELAILLENDKPTEPSADNNQIPDLPVAFEDSFEDEEIDFDPKVQLLKEL